MKSVVKPLLLTGLMAAALSTLAQPAPPDRGGPENHERMQEQAQRHMERRAADLKTKLKLNADQEGAWNQYTAAMKPPVYTRAQAADFEKLSTPERLDKMRELRKQREAEIDKREHATRAFYATLNPEQKKVFDAHTVRPMGGPDERRRPKD